MQITVMCCKKIVALRNEKGSYNLILIKKKPPFIVAL